MPRILREMQDNMESGAGYEGTDEYTPMGADPAAIDKTARDVTVEGPARAAIHVAALERRRKRVYRPSLISRPIGIEVISLSCMESRGQRTSRSHFRPQEYRPDTYTRPGGAEPGADPICENLGPDNRRLDLSRDFHPGFALVPLAESHRAPAPQMQSRSSRV